MKKIIAELLLVVMIVFSVMAALSLYDLASSPSDNQAVPATATTTTSAITTTTTAPAIDPNIDKITTIAQRVAKLYSYREYGPYWDCTKYSMDLVYELRKEGYSADRAYGVYTCTEPPGLHEWVVVSLNGKQIPIEATSGTIIPDDIYERCYEFRHWHPVP